MNHIQLLKFVEKKLRSRLWWNSITCVSIINDFIINIYTAHRIYYNCFYISHEYRKFPRIINIKPDQFNLTIFQFPITISNSNFIQQTILYHQPTPYRAFQWLSIATTIATPAKFNCRYRKTSSKSNRPVLFPDAKPPPCSSSSFYRRQKPT